MATFNDLLMAQIKPSRGGLTFRNIGTPYGLRSYKTEDGSYGGEMMPKGLGWLGALPNTNGDVSTELSIGDESGEFPSLVPTLNKEQINQLLNLQENEQVPTEIYKLARQHADKMRSQGRSPFKEILER